MSNPSNNNQSSGCSCNFEYNCVLKYTRIFTLSIAGTLVGVGIYKFTRLDTIIYPMDVIIRIYLM